jgi:hypothetical protein
VAKEGEKEEGIVTFTYTAGELRKIGRSNESL